MNISLILENQFNYLNRKYGERVGEANVHAAINLDARNAEKLLFGLATDVITEITPESIPLVQDLDPFARQTQKTEGHIKYEQMQKRAQEISRKYYQWILKVWKAAGEEVAIPAEVFDYLEANDIELDDIKDSSLEKVQADSEEWHSSLKQIESSYGAYKHGIDTPGTAMVSGYYFVPLHKDDAALEGKTMQNCIGPYLFNHSGQYVMSMRNAHNRPFVDIRIINHDTVSEIKGRQNRLPVPKYQKAVLDWLLTTDYTVRGSDFNALLEENPKYVSKFVKMIEWDINTFNKFSSYLSENDADRILLKLIDDDSSLVVSLELKGLSARTLLAVYNGLKGTATQHKLYDKMIGDYETFAAKGIGQEQWLELAGDDNACLASYRSVFEPESFLETILRLPVSEFHLLYPRYENALANFNALSGDLTPYAAHVCRAASISRSSYSYNKRAQDNFPDTILYCIPHNDLYTLFDNICKADLRTGNWMAAEFIENYHSIGERNAIIRNKQNSLDLSKLMISFIQSASIAKDSGCAAAYKEWIKLLLDLNGDQMKAVYEALPAVVRSNMPYYQKAINTAKILIKTTLNINEYDLYTQIDVARSTKDKEILEKLATSDQPDVKKVATRRLRRITRLEGLK